MESFAPIKRIEGQTFKSTKQIVLYCANLYSHVTVICEVELDIIGTKTSNDLDLATRWDVVIYNIPVQLMWSTFFFLNSYGWCKSALIIPIQKKNIILGWET